MAGDSSGFPVGRSVGPALVANGLAAAFGALLHAAGAELDVLEGYWLCHEVAFLPLTGLYSRRFVITFMCSEGLTPRGWGCSGAEGALPGRLFVDPAWMGMFRFRQPVLPRTGR